MFVCQFFSLLLSAFSRFILSFLVYQHFSIRLVLSAFFYPHFSIRIRHPQVSGPRFTDTLQEQVVVDDNWILQYVTFDRVGNIIA